MYAVILAAGEGERLRPYTLITPKQLLDIAGKPVIGYQIDALEASSITDVVIVERFFPEQFWEYFDQRESRLKFHHLIVPGEKRESGGDLKLALREVPAAQLDVPVFFGDILFQDLDTDDLLRQHGENRPIATLVTAPYKFPYGIIEHDANSQVVGFIEKPTFEINTGITVISREAFSTLPEVGSLFQYIMENFPAETLMVYPHEGYWRDIGTEHDLISAREYFEGKTGIEDGTNYKGKER